MHNPNKNGKLAKIGLILTDPEDWTTQAFVKNIKKRGVQPVPLNLSALSASLSIADLSIFAPDFKDVELDAVIVRDVGISFALEQISFKFDLLRHYETFMPVMNSSAAIQNAANKFVSSYLFKGAHLPIPRTTITSKLDVALNALEQFGSAIAKPIFGSQGKGIIKFERTQPDLTSKIAVLLKERGVLYLQEFVPNPDRDIRVFVVGDETLDAIYRVSVSGSFISNLSQGGTPLKCELTEEMRELAIRATKAVGADFAGVDLIEGEEGLYVLEVNATPSAKGIYRACGIDVTEKIVELLFERIEDKAKKSSTF